MNKRIIELLSKGINSGQFTNPELIKWSKNEHNNNLINLLTKLFTPSNSMNNQTNYQLDEIKKELSIKIAARESQEKLYAKRGIKGILIGATSAAAVASILFLTIPRINHSDSDFTHNISVMYNNQSATVLSDGTKVILRPGSNLTYNDFNKTDQRIVELDGEAYFDVVKTEKEFIVVAGESRIKVLGTKFNVKANEYDNFVETILLSGSVEFQYTDSIMGEKSIIMSSNEQLTFDKETKHYNLSENRKPLEYIINDEYKFDNVPLSEVFNVISDIYELKVIVDDEKINNVRYTGVIRRSHSFSSTMKILSEVVSIKYYMGEKGVIVTLKQN